MQNLSRAENLAAWLCGAGLLLSVAGYWAMRYIPMTPEEEETERLLQEVYIPAFEDMAGQDPDSPHVQLVRDQLQKASIRHRRPPPYRGPGIAAFAIGISTFVAGGVIWLRRSDRWRPSHWTKANEDA